MAAQMYYEADADPRAMLNMYRLIYDRGEMTRESEYVNYADGALDAGLLFLAYQRDPREQFVPIQARLARSC